MRHLFFSVTAALALAGCAADRQDADSSSTASRATVAQQTLRTTALAGATRHATFASLPDHGALLAYTPGRETMQRGAETYRAVQLSEAHALNAAARGRLIELPTPSGETVRIGFQRVEEGLDGNWSWIGRTADGQDAVITFGEKAVFGRIGQRGTEALRLTTAGGRAWLVETDPSRVLDANRVTGARDHDMLIRPNAAAAAIAAKRSAASTTTSTIPTKAGAADTVDVVVGYTNGMVSRFGSASAAETRVANLVALTNQAYANSQVTPRVRLVKTLQVAYTDTNSNEVALEAVTGVTCNTTSCSPQTVPAELVPLRTARDQYGGDLVALLRPLKSPEQGGCGIAWLLGGGGFPIDNTDADFGYSVVSDGTDVDETDGKTYSCVETAFAHELGHNMGQQHNVEDSGGDSGTHSYSYGYREATSTGFYTVMAYRLPNSSQFNIAYFGNPNVNYADTGRPTGTANANNAASLNISMPLVAQFRSVVVPFPGKFRNDINANGTSDLLWYNQSSGQFAYWLMNNTTVVSTGVQSVGTNFRIAGTGDLNGDGAADIIWRDVTNNYHYLWRSNGNGTFTTPWLGAIGAGWSIARLADINGDGKDDIIWENPSAGQMAYWLMNDTTVTSTSVRTVGTDYRIVGAGDFDGDGRGDILWRNQTNGYLYLWRSRGDGTFDTSFVAGIAAGWNIAAVVDLNGDGTSDIVWEETTQGLMAYWFMNGATVTSTGVKAVGTDYRIMTSGDLNGDGRGDLVWGNATTGYLYLWRSLGNGNFETPYLAGYAPGWTLTP